jgi:hypothetical protein
MKQAVPTAIVVSAGKCAADDRKKLPPRAGFEPATNRLTAGNDGVAACNLPVRSVSRLGHCPPADDLGIDSVTLIPPCIVTPSAEERQDVSPAVVLAEDLVKLLRRPLGFAWKLFQPRLFGCHCVQRFVLDEWPRISRNSDGPLISRRFRCSRSSAGADGSLI